MRRHYVMAFAPIVLTVDAYVAVRAITATEASTATPRFTWTRLRMVRVVICDSRFADIPE
jgi:hypothetical protein